MQRSMQLCYACKKAGATEKQHCLHYFRFPKEDARCQAWIANGNFKELEVYTALYLNNTFKLCEKHFETAAFTNIMKKRLNHNAIPTIFNGKQIQNTSHELPAKCHPVPSAINKDLDYQALPECSTHSQSGNLKAQQAMKGLSVIQYLPLDLQEENLVEFDEDIGEDLAQQLLSSLCRLCACTSGKLMPIFGPRGNHLILADKISQHLPLKVSPDDFLPLQVCTNCSLRLDAFHRMTKVCEEADKTLRSWFVRKGGKTTLKTDISADEETSENKPVISCMDPGEKMHDDKENEDINMDAEASMTSTNTILEESQGISSKTPTNEARDSDDDADWYKKLAFDTNIGVFEPVLHEKRVKTKKQKEPSKSVRMLEYTCVICSEVIIGRSNCSVHIGAIHHKQWCYECNALFDNSRQLSEHIVNVHRLTCKSVNQIQVYTCKICSKGIVGKFNLAMHIEAIHQKEWCQLCDVILDNSCELAKHNEDLHKVKCKECNIEFSTRSDCNYHFNTFHNDRHKCETCGKEFPFKQDLERHAISHSNERIVKCLDPTCDKTFKDRSTMRSHLKVHLPEGEKNKFLCSVCSKGFPTQSKLHCHTRMHTGERPYACEKCPKKFGSKTSLNVHMVAHDGKREHKCDECDMVYKHHSNLDKHKKVVHCGKWDYKCSLCNNIYSTIKEVEEHFDSHSHSECKSLVSVAKYVTISEWKCDVCEKYYLNKERLKDHKKKCRARNELPVPVRTRRKATDIDGPKFICEYCGNTILTKSGFQVHIRTHLNIRPNTCHICNKSFILKNNLVFHIRRHNKETPYECDICGKKFNRACNRNKHRRCVHLNHRPYKCPVCDKAFKTSSAFSAHHRIHTGERPYACDICHRTFVQKPDMKRHRERHVKALDMSSFSGNSVATPH